METKHAVIFGGMLVIAFVFLIVSGAAYESWWGMLTLIPYTAIPLMGALCPAIAGDSDSSSLWNQWGYFLEAFFWVSTFGIPSVCLHVEAIDEHQFGLVFASNLLVFFAFMGIAKVQSDSY